VRDHVRMFIRIWSKCKGLFKWYICWPDWNLRSLYLKRNVQCRDAFGHKDKVHSYSYRKVVVEGIHKYPRKLGSLRKAESVADRGAEEKTELGLIYGYKFSSRRGNGNTIQAQFSSSLTPVPRSCSRLLLLLSPPLLVHFLWSLLGDLEKPWTRES